MTLTIGSLFTGAGMLDRAVEEVFDARTAWVSDIDKGACKVLAHRYPGVPNLGDITTIDWATVEPVDIIAGGSPCQDLSSAGRRAGMTDGTRSNLWVQMREAIAILKPTFVVWENVRGALSADAASDLEHCPGCMGDPADRGPVLRALGRVLGDLAELGFDAEVRSLRAADVGACHGRFRVFLLAWRRAAFADPHHAGLQGHADPPRASQAGRHGHAESGAGRPDLALLPTVKASNNENRSSPWANGPNLLEAITPLLPTPAASVANDGEGTETWLARRERVKLTAANGNGMGMPLTIAVRLLPTPTTEPATGNGHARNLGKEVQLLPTPSANLGNNGGPQHPDKRRAGGHSVSIEDAIHGLALHQLLPTPSVADSTGGHERRGGARGGELLLKGIAKYELADRWGDYAAAIARHEQALGRPAPAPTEPGPKGNPRLSAAFVEWMMMLPAGWITAVPGVTRNEALKMLGNGVVGPQCVAALRIMLGRTI